jgi:hypothetical protein
MILKNILITTILISVVIVGLSAVTFEMASGYGTTYDSSWNNTYNVINDVSTNLNDSNNKINAEGIQSTSFWEYFSNGAWSSIMSFKNTASLGKAMLTDVQTRYNIPTLYISAGVTIISITILFSLLSVIFRRTT